MASPLVPDELWEGGGTDDPEGRAPLPLPRSQARARPPDPDRHPLRLEDGHSLGGPPSRDGLRSGVTCWRRLREWQEQGVWQKLHEVLLAKLNSGLGQKRWVVERTLSWLHQYRRLRVRYERRADIHEAFLIVGCCLICFKQLQAAE